MSSADDTFEAVEEQAGAMLEPMGRFDLKPIWGSPLSDPSGNSVDLQIFLSWMVMYNVARQTVYSFPMENVGSSQVRLEEGIGIWI